MQLFRFDTETKKDEGTHPVYNEHKHLQELQGRFPPGNLSEGGCFKVEESVPIWTNSPAIKVPRCLFLEVPLPISQPPAGSPLAASSVFRFNMCIRVRESLELGRCPPTPPDHLRDQASPYIHQTPGFWAPRAAQAHSTICTPSTLLRQLGSSGFMELGRVPQHIYTLLDGGITPPPSN